MPSRPESMRPIESRDAGDRVLISAPFDCSEAPGRAGLESGPRREIAAAGDRSERSTDSTLSASQSSWTGCRSQGQAWCRRAAERQTSFRICATYDDPHLIARGSREPSSAVFAVRSGSVSATAIGRQEGSPGGMLRRKLDLGTRWGSRLGTSAGTGKRVVLTAVGSLGDLHPYLAIALGLKARGHDAIVATSECYRQKVLDLGLGFRPIRPDSEFVSNPDVMRRFMDLQPGNGAGDPGLASAQSSANPTKTRSPRPRERTCSSRTRPTSRPAWSPKRRVSGGCRPWPARPVSSRPLSPPLLPGYPGLSKTLRFLGPAFWGPLGHILKRATRLLGQTLVPASARAWLAPHRGAQPAGGRPVALAPPRPLLEMARRQAARLARADSDHRLPVP